MQGIPGRFLTRRGSAPTTGMPAMGCRGGQDRRSDPTQYRSHSFLANLNNNIMASFLRDPELADYAGSKGKKWTCFYTDLVTTVLTN